MFLIVDEAHNFKTSIDAALQAQKRRRGSDDAKEPRALKAQVAIACAKQVWKVLLLTATPVYDRPYDVANLVCMVRGLDYMSEADFERQVKDDAWFAQFFANAFSFYRPPPDNDRFPRVVETNVDLIMSRDIYDQYKRIERQTDTRFGDHVWEFYAGLRQASMALKPSIKCEWTVARIQSHPVPTLVASSFLEHGLDLVKAEVRALGIPFVEVTGVMPQQQRQLAVDKFNRGEVRLMFLSDAGSEGLDVMGTRQVIILESNWNRASIDQIIGRAARDGSHVHLPLEERVVEVFLVMQLKPLFLDADDTHPGSADEILRKIETEKQAKNQAFLDRLTALGV